MSLKTFIYSRGIEFVSLSVVETLGAFGDKTKIRDSIELSSMACCAGIKGISEHSKTNIFPHVSSLNSVKCFLIDVIYIKGC